MSWVEHDWRRHDWRDWTRRAGLKPVSSVDGMIPIETLRSQCELVAIDIDTDAASGVSHPDDPLLLTYLDAAIEHAEEFTGLSIALRTFDLALDRFPHGRTAIEVPHPPLINVESFTAVGGGSEGELDLGDDYLVDDFAVPGRIVPATSWPNLTASLNNVRVRFRAGYQTEGYFDSDYAGARELPKAIKLALLLLVAHFYEHRSDTVEKALTLIPNGVESLLRPKRILLGMA